MSTVPYRKVNRNQVYKDIVKMINESPNREVEISSSELADRFDVQAPTMDYHLKILIEDGLLSISPKRGRYNRKIYRIPSSYIEEHTQTEIHKPFESDESAEKFQKFLSDHLTKDKKEPDEVDALPEDESPLIIEPLSLDDQIKMFLSESEKVHAAEELLEHGDREILAVMSETIHQTTVYLKDLSEQLSTVKNKSLIQGLIDDRNRMQGQLEHSQKDADQARSEADQTIKDYDLDPARIRFMHQMIVSTLDDYLNQTNQSIALGRKDFREKISKEVSDLVKYTLKIED